MVLLGAICLGVLEVEAEQVSVVCPSGAVAPEGILFVGSSLPEASWAATSVCEVL